MKTKQQSLRKIYGLILTVSIVISFIVSPFNSNAQFKGVPGGFSAPPSTTIKIIGYRLSGGGVVLRGVAKPSSLNQETKFLDIQILRDDSDNASLIFTTAKCPIVYNIEGWILKDAWSVVSTESDQVYYRDADLLSAPRPYEDTLKYPRHKYFFVELNQALLKTRTGSNLILVDILQTDVDFYSTASTDVVNEFRNLKREYIKNDIAEVAKTLNESDIERLGQMFDEDFDPNKLDDIETDDIKKMLAIFMALEVESEAFLLDSVAIDMYSSNWTYNDELTSYEYSCDCESGKLSLVGRPYFTYLIDEEEDMVMSDFAINNYSLIESLRPETFNEVITYSRALAFLRHLKKNHVQVWQSLSAKVVAIPSKFGTTPRTIER